MGRSQSDVWSTRPQVEAARHFMHVLDALRESSADPADRVEVGESRLLCSGILYNGNVGTYDWTKSDVCRSLLRGRIVFFVVSQPIDSYPQELLLSIPIKMVTEEHSTSEGISRVSLMSFPHLEVVEDMAALLTLLLRRLITVHSHVRATANHPIHRDFGLDGYPRPIADARPGIVWRRRPMGVMTKADGQKEVDDPNAPPVGVDANWLETVLAAIQSLPAAETIVACARLYSGGMF